MIKKIFNLVFFLLSRLLLPVIVFLLLSIHKSYAAQPPLRLTLQDAIFLAVRNNPNVQSAQLDRVLSKWSVYVAQWEFFPHYSITASAFWDRNIATGQPVIGSHSYNIGPTIRWNTPIGTQFVFNQSNPNIYNQNYPNGTYNPGVSLNIIQPLLRGFGRPIVEQALENARDSDVISQLSAQSVLRSTVSSVVTAYLDVVGWERVVMIDQKALERAKTSVEQTKKFIKAGHKAGNELVTVEANVASAQSTLENDKNGLQQSRYGLLAAIGLNPNSHVVFSSLDLDALTNKYHQPTLEETKTLALQNDVSYQTAVITLHGSTKRNVIKAEDNMRWKLDATINVTRNASSDDSINSGLNNIVNGYNQGQSVRLDLTIPLDNQADKQALESAKIALKKAEIALRKDKWDKETGAINNWNSVLSAKRSLQYAESAEHLQQKTYDISYQKYLHGLIDSLELQSAQLQLISSQQSLLNARINYIKSLVNLDLLLGRTLKTWNVKTRIL